MLNKRVKFLGVLILVVSLAITMAGCDMLDSDSEPDFYTLTVVREGEGEVLDGEGNVILDSESKVEELEVEEGASIEIEAVFAEGWRFSHWKGEVEGKNSTETAVIIDENKNITAVFEKELEETATVSELKGEAQEIFASAWNIIIPFTEAESKLGVTKDDLLELRINDEVYEMVYNEANDEFIAFNVLGYIEEEVKSASVGFYSNQPEVSGSSGIEAVVFEVGDEYIEVSMFDWAVAFYEGEGNELYDYISGSAIIGIVSAGDYYDFNSYATQFYIHKSFAEAIAETEELDSDIVDKIKLWPIDDELLIEKEVTGANAILGDRIRGSLRVKNSFRAEKLLLPDNVVFDPSSREKSIVLEANNERIRQDGDDKIIDFNDKPIWDFRVEDERGELEAVIVDENNEVLDDISLKIGD